jgi:hypothetical protein
MKTLEIRTLPTATDRNRPARRRAAKAKFDPPRNGAFMPETTSQQSPIATFREVLPAPI